GDRLAPGGQQDVRAADGLAGCRVDGDARQLTVDHATVVGGARRCRTVVSPRLAVVAVERVDRRVLRIVRVDGQAEQATIPVVVDAGAQIDRRGRRRVPDGVVGADH